ncbi:MAG: GTPase domain-containing protein [Sandaracinaceae bacterium]|nr:gliding-motility protein MglA [Myxococcales bacterium]
MPLVNHAHREIHLKVVYYGPGLGGKTTNLELIHGRTKPERRGKLISLATEAERTLFFDLLPVELGTFKGYQVRLHLCTVPGQIAHDRTRRLVLRHVDGIVFVVDSQPARLADNIESIHNLASNLRLQGDDPDELPLVVQYNKRDLPDVLDVAELREALAVPAGVPELEAIAVDGRGVFETVKTILKLCLKIIGDPETAREGRSPSILPGQRASMFPMAPGTPSSGVRRDLVGDVPLPPPAGTPSLGSDE